MIHVRWQAEERFSSICCEPITKLTLSRLLQYDSLARQGTRFERTKGAQQREGVQSGCMGVNERNARTTGPGICCRLCKGCPLCLLCFTPFLSCRERALRVAEAYHSAHETCRRGKNHSCDGVQLHSACLEYWSSGARTVTHSSLAATCDFYHLMLLRQPRNSL
ncbi:hypothetical protein K431DRAFT_111071 [Polychaeton citri CBS 116435]|uniref:Uncharacterized protein n=1 Tax=Polychaeton citri CBS 116435 TaxID=1314669 RepID=A0A9P4Q7F7_9PEZI|nr:hypothetical protein K431DRAFT_111071 [Polychaeton citri CBS 116435]